MDTNELRRFIEPLKDTLRQLCRKCLARMRSIETLCRPMYKALRLGPEPTPQCRTRYHGKISRRVKTLRDARSALADAYAQVGQHVAPITVTVAGVTSPDAYDAVLRMVKRALVGFSSGVEAYIDVFPGLGIDSASLTALDSHLAQQAKHDTRWAEQGRADKDRFRRPAEAADDNSQVGANQPKLFSDGVPKDPDLLDLMARLDSESGSGKSKNQIARDFTGETTDNCPKAKKLLARLRKRKQSSKQRS